MKKSRSAGVAVDFATLNHLYTTGTPSLAAITTPYYHNRISGAEGWLDELAKASGNTYQPGSPQNQGGTYGGYLFDEYGLDLEQIIEKGLFGAAFYNHAFGLMQNNPTPETADQLVCIFGAHPDFPNTDNANKATNPDRFMAQYAARRDKNDGTGFDTQIKNAFIKLQAAEKAGDQYREEQQEALETIRITWEKINFATVINYCHFTISKLSATNPTDVDKASALHAYAEAVAFVHGWRTLPTASRRITDTQIDELLTLLRAPYNDTPTAYLFLTDPVNQLPQLTQVIEKLKSIYGFSAQEIADFKENWVTKQGR
ncbi:MAG: hypothetical protein JNK89_02245 [Saprospiraceae bacterium]|nr:hypothetical protein [Saprospiraceae bacterium]